MRKIFNKFVYFMMSLVLVFGFSTHIHALEDSVYTLENNFIRANYEVKNNKFFTKSINNLWTNEAKNTISFTEDSDEFSIKLKEKIVPKNWTVTVSSESYAEGANNRKEAIVDSDPNTYWHTNYNSNGTGPRLGAFPHWAEITFNEAMDIRSFMYHPRNNHINANGNARNYKLYLKESGQANFTLAKEGTLEYTQTKPIWIELDSLKRNVVAAKFEIHSTKNGRNFGLIAELDFSDKTLSQMASKRDENTIFSKDLDVARVEKTEEREQKKIVVEYAPYVKQGTTFNIKKVSELGTNDKFIRSYLEISTSLEENNNFKIDTIDLQSYKIAEEDILWKLPQQQNIAEMGGFNGFYAGLGQPVYLKGAFYTGSEFPLAHNNVENTTTLFSRYYSGKSIADHGQNLNTYKTWPVVIGVSRNTKYEVVQQDFYDYLRAVGTETRFRKQYNSWFDFMKNFNAKNIQHSFKEVDEGFSSYGVSPLDSYVVDDGWQDNNTVWDFNLRTFPNKLYDSSRDVKRLGSDFGLWLGPQGGYGDSTRTISDAAVRENKGSKNGRVVNVGDKRYVDYLKVLLSSYQDKFDINYWKLDGMLLSPLSNSTEHYIGGGHMNMYSMTETHERWIELYKLLRENRAGKDLWINLTSYINPSPWFLQWVNSIWMQNAGDVDYQDGVKKEAYINIDFGDDSAEAITYRDDRYEEVVKLRQWQLPFSNIYNHDPVYGKTANSGKKLHPRDRRDRPQINFTTEGFRDYLYMLGTRGTGFWEFYYSPSMLDDDKWQVNAEAVNWIEDNFEVLRNSKIHGGKPGHGEVYGYSAWTQDEGIISIRNPREISQEYTLVLDNTIGMFEGTSAFYQKVVHGDLAHSRAEALNYGSSIQITLKPYETVIFSYKKARDEKEPEVIGKRSIANNIVEIEFDERINKEGAVFKLGETVLEHSQKADLRTFVITLNRELQDKEVVNITYENIKDVASIPNIANGNENITFYNGGNILNIANVLEGASIPNTGIEGKEEFTVSLRANLTEYNQVLAEQEDAWKLYVDEEGIVNFKLKDLTVKSSPFRELKEDDNGEADTVLPLNEDVDIKAVRYESGSIRIYINGLVSNTKYEKENAKEVLEKSSVSIGSEDFKGSIKNFRLVTSALKYDEIAKENDREFEGVEEVEVINTEATSYDPDDGGSHEPGLATDDDFDTYWASDKNRNNITEKQYLVIELEEVKDIKLVRYVPRQIANAVGTIKRAKIEVSVDKDTWIPFGGENGEHNFGDPSDYSSKLITVDDAIKGKYVRLTALETHHWKAENLNKVVSVAEFSAYGEKADENTITYDYLEGQAQRFRELVKEDYNATKYDEVKAIFDRANEILSNKDGFSGTQDDVDNLYKELKDAINNLLVVNTSDLEELIRESEELQASEDYEERTKEDKRGEFEEKLRKAKEVLNSQNKKQKEVDKALNDLRLAKEGVIKEEELPEPSAEKITKKEHEELTKEEIIAAVSNVENAEVRLTNEEEVLPSEVGTYRVNVTVTYENSRVVHIDVEIEIVESYASASNPSIEQVVKEEGQGVSVREILESVTNVGSNLRTMELVDENQIPREVTNEPAQVEVKIIYTDDSFKVVSVPVSIRAREVETDAQRYDAQVAPITRNDKNLPNEEDIKEAVTAPAEATIREKRVVNVDAIPRAKTEDAVDIEVEITWEDESKEIVLVPVTIIESEATKYTAQVESISRHDQNLPSEEDVKAAITAPAEATIREKRVVNVDAIPRTKTENAVNIEVEITWEDESKEVVNVPVTITESEATRTNLTISPVNKKAHERVTENDIIEAISGSESASVKIPATSKPLPERVGRHEVAVEVTYQDGSIKIVNVELTIVESDANRLNTRAERVSKKEHNPLVKADILEAIIDKGDANVRLAHEDEALPSTVGTHRVSVIVEYTDGSTKNLEVVVEILRSDANSTVPKARTLIKKENSKLTKEEILDSVYDKGSGVVSLTNESEVLPSRVGNHRVNVTVTYEDESVDTLDVPVVIFKVEPKDETENENSSTESGGNTNTSSGSNQNESSGNSSSSGTQTPPSSGSSSSSGSYGGGSYSLGGSGIRGGKTSVKKESLGIKNLENQTFFGGGNWIKNPSGYWSYLINSSKVRNSWIKDNNSWFRTDKDGKLIEESWIFVNNNWFYAKKGGYILENRWFNVNGKWYYAKEGGYVVLNQWMYIGNKWYHFNKDGDLSIDTYVNGVYVDKTGAIKE